MCSKHLRTMVKGDWVVAYRLHYGHPVQVPNDHDERFWIARQLIDDYRWSVSRAAQALGFNVSRFASMEDRLAVAS